MKNPKAGIAWKGEFLAIEISESPTIAEVRSLSDTLEIGPHPEHVYLTAKDAEKMIGRLARYGKSDSPLAVALRTFLAGQERT